MGNRLPGHSYANYQAQRLMLLKKIYIYIERLRPLSLSGTGQIEIQNSVNVRWRNGKESTVQAPNINLRHLELQNILMVCRILEGMSCNIFDPWVMVSSGQWHTLCLATGYETRILQLVPCVVRQGDLVCRIRYSKASILLRQMENDKYEFFSICRAPPWLGRDLGKHEWRALVSEWEWDWFKGFVDCSKESAYARKRKRGGSNGWEIITICWSAKSTCSISKVTYSDE